MKNIMLLDDEVSGGVVYVNKITYDQALMLSARMDGDPARVLALLTTAKTEAYKATLGLKPLVDDMIKTMPKPLNMLAPFLIFCVQNTTITWDAHDREFAYGILHIYSQMIDFNAMTLVPAEVRNNITFPTSVLMTYKESWDDLCSTLKDKTVLTPTVQYVTQPAQVAPAPAPAQPTSIPAPANAVSTEAPKPAEESEEDDLEAFARKMAEEAAEEDKKRAERQKKLDAIAGSTGTNKQESKPVEKTEAAEAAAVLDEFDC